MQEREERREAYRRIWRRSPQMAPILENYPVPEDTVGLVGSYVLAPALGSFVQWLLHEAAGSGKKRLYFFARDGYFPYRAAQVFCETHHLPIECRYLYCSRYSLRLPLFHLDREAALTYVCRGGIDVTMERILRRGGLTEEERQAVLQQLSLPFAPGKVLPHAKLPYIRRCLGKCTLFLTYMDRHSRAALPGLIGYLTGEGLLEDIPYALVDSGWVGSMQKTIGDVLAFLGQPRRLEGYYWGLYDLPADVFQGDYHTYYFSPEKQLAEKIYFNNCLFEAIYTAPHGMTLSYRQKGGQYIPCCGQIREAGRAFVSRMEACLLPYIRCLAKTGVAVLDAGTLQRDRGVVYRLLRQFMSRPSREEAEAFGSLPFSDDVLEGDEQQLAAPLTQRELQAYHLLPRLGSIMGLWNHPVRESAWYEGSAVRGGKRVGHHLRQYRLYQAIRQIRKMIQFRKERGWRDAGL